MTRINAQDITAAQNTITALADLYPACFAVFQERRKPLKLGIHHDILTALNGAITPRECANAMRMYCGNVGYLKACTEGAERIGLSGEAAGQVTAAEADNARARLAQRKQARRQSNGASRPIARVDTTKIKPAMPRLSLSDLRKAAAQRRQLAAAE